MSLDSTFSALSDPTRRAILARLALGETSVTRVPVGGFGNPTFTGPPGVTLTPNEQALTAHLGLNYAFRDWVSAVLDYYYSEIVSSDAALIEPYTRDQINVGISLTY